MTNNGQTPGGNTTTAGAVEQLAMARRIAADIWERRAMAWREREGLPDNVQWRASTRNAWERGDYDAEDAVQAAHEAISKTQEACARLADSLEPSGDLADEAEFFLGACSHGEKIAAAIRLGHHYGKDET